MKTMDKFASVFVTIAALTLVGCANMNATPYPPNPNVASSGDVYSGYGVVHSIELVQQDQRENTDSRIGLGTIVGAVIGGVVGNQIGSGRGNTAATVVGALGGAYVGHELEKRQQQMADAYRITVRMDDGSYQSLMKSTNSDVRVGDQVLLNNGVLQRY